MKKIFYFLTTLLAFFTALPAGFSQKGGSAPDTALESAVYFVNIKKPQPFPPPPPGSKEESDTYMIVVTGIEEEEDSLPPRKRVPRTIIYKVSCSTCNVLRVIPAIKTAPKTSTSPARTINSRALSTVTGGSAIVADEALKRQLLKALMEQANAANRLFQEMKLP